MKRNCLVLISFLLLLSMSAFAAGPGNVEVKFPGNEVFTGTNNTFELWINNAGALKGMSIGFGFTSMVPGYSWLTPHGNMPAGTPYVQEFGDAIGKFDLGGLMFTSTSLPSSFLLGGAALAAPLPAHAASTKLYDLVLVMPADGGDYPGGFTADNIFFPPAGSWKFDEGGPGGAYPPTYQGNTNTSSANPDAPAVAWRLRLRPCANPVFTSTPVLPVSKNHCSAYTFQFAATEGGNATPANPVTFTTSVGTINGTTGELSVPASLACGTTDVVVTAHNTCQGATDFPFTITWTNNVPTITNCPATTQKVGKGNTYTLDLNSLDSDPCDGGGSVWTVAQTSGPSVTGQFSINALGVFSFATLTANGGNTYCFDATFTDPCGAAAVCHFCVEVLNTQPFIIQIEKTHKSLQGHYEYVSITEIDGSEMMGGFDFLIAYDATASDVLLGYYWRRSGLHVAGSTSPIVTALKATAVARARAVCCA